MSKQGRPSGFPKDAWALLDGPDARTAVRRAWDASRHRNPPTAQAIVAEVLGTPIETVQERLAAARQAKEAERARSEAGRIVVHCDGACEPRNPGGTATFGWVARRGGELMASDCGVVARGPRATNNLAEYTAIIKVLEWLEEAGHADETIVLRSDSQLAIYQLVGTYAVRSPAIWPLWSEASRLARRFSSLRFEWVRRSQNEEADALTRKAYEQDRGAQDDERAQRAAELLAGARRTATGWSVPSSTGRVSYEVHLEPEHACICPDFLRRRRDCKHILAVLAASSAPT